MFEINPKDTETELVSVGVPVFNGEKTIEDAVNTILQQSYQNIEIIISDNSSNDGTELICRKLEKCYSRIRYVRQESNIGALSNFNYVLENSRGRFFMWAASDDIWAPNFIERNVDWLRSNPDYVGSITAASNGGDVDPLKSGSTTIAGEDAKERVIQFVLEKPGANARFYSLFRKDAFKGIRIDEFNYWAGDWSIMIILLLRGKLKCLDGDIGFKKNGDGASSDTVGMMDCLRRSKWEYIFPYLFYSHLALQATDWDFRCVLRLLKLNYRAAKGYLRDVRKRKRSLL